MRQKTEIKILAVLVVLLIGLALLAGCAKKIVGNQEVGVRFEIPTEGVISAKLLTSIDRFEITVEGEGIEERLIFPLVLENGFVTGEIEVPSGPRRLFTLKAIGFKGETIYLGISIVDVFAGRTVVVDIPLVPLVPILTMTPRYQRVEMNNNFVVDFVLHNVQDVSYISFEFESTNGPFNSFPLSGTAGRDIDTTIATFGYGNGEIGPHVWISSRNQFGDITSPTGTTHLATMEFNSYRDWFDTIAPVTFSIGFMTVDHFVDTIFTPLNIFDDEAEVFLWTRPFQGE